MADTLWGIHDGETSQAQTLFLVHGYIAVGWPAMGGLGELPNDRKAFKARYQQVYPGSKQKRVDQDAGQLYRFVHEMKVGDYVAYRPKPPINGTSYVFLGRVTGPYVYNPFLHDYGVDVRRVEWLRSVPISRFSEGALKELGAYLTLFQIDTHADEFFAALAESK